MAPMVPIDEKALGSVRYYTQVACATILACVTLVHALVYCIFLREVW